MRTAAAESSEGNWSGSATGLRVSRIGYALCAAVVSSLAGSLVSAVVDGGQGAEESIRSFIESSGVGLLLVLALFFAPLIETLLLGWILLLLLERQINRYVAILLSATIWTAAHSFDGPSGLAVFFPFVAYSSLFVARRDHADGYFLAALTHFFVNLIAVTEGYFQGVLSG